MASAKLHTSMNGKERIFVIKARNGKLILSPREADEILADLQIIYHKLGMGIEVDDGES